MSWVLGWDLPGAYHLWFWLHDLLAIGSAIVLWLWWRPFGERVAWVIAVLFALMTAIPNNHAMGQANFPGLILSLAGLWQTERKRPIQGGMLMGAACMLKMSPALFVVWWMVRREWTAVGAAIAAGVALSFLSLPFAGPAVQWHFYTGILPTFSSGDYNGLSVAIELFGNHSLPNLLDQIAPSAGDTLSPVARILSAVLGLGLVGGAAWWFRDPAPDAFARAAQASCFGVLLLLLPVYTYEHHLVFALPAAVISVLAVHDGRLGPRWAIPVGICVTLLLFDLQVLKGMSRSLPDPIWFLSGVVRELKFVALLGLLASTLRVGRPERLA
jgi:alpha-1,2-mannosyltransferase